jgi:hypothetical protein
MELAFIVTRGLTFRQIIRYVLFPMVVFMFEFVAGETSD